MHRRSLLVAGLGLSLLVPTVGYAQEVAPSASPVLPPSAVGSPLPSALPTSASPSPSTEVVAATEPEATPLPEPDFKVGTWELRRLPWNALRLTNRRPIELFTQGPRDAKGVPMRPMGPGGKLVYNPTVVAQQGMKRLDAYRKADQRIRAIRAKAAREDGTVALNRDQAERVKSSQRERRIHSRFAKRFADALTRISDGGRQRRWQPHPYDLGVHERGWVNSNSHGLVLSFLSRFHRLTGEERYLRQARLLFKAFEQRPGNQRWFSNVTKGGYVWFEHWPDGTKNHTLNAHINAIFGLYDYWLASGDPRAEQYIQGGIKTVRDKLYRFRRKGELSRYSMASTVGTLHYHETHIEQLRILARMTGDEWFRRQAKRMEQDERAWKVKYRGARP